MFVDVLDCFVHLSSRALLLALVAHLLGEVRTLVQMNDSDCMIGNRGRSNPTPADDYYYPKRAVL